ncbi:hypothetical protein TCAL_12021 [Tigriopus californicus]|uniref:G-protein coupled receptors family 1 profile domain-containing protein n=2 Tax=Tigriopus californicus TaxID=6832 RepID=A0A553NSG6_TIGCA|nr:hypothetical protein TCAL_12021 [Tigriopus californicus]
MYMDQVDWTSVAHLRNDSALDNTPIGLVAMTHKNFTNIIDSVLARNPNTTFHYFEETIADMKEKLNYHQQPCPNSSGATLEEQSVALSIEFIFGVILQAMVGGFGVVGNICAISVILKSSKLRSVFNYILVCSLLIHTSFILSALTIEVYKKVGGKTFGEIFCHFLYAFRPMLLHSSTFLTVLMARERLRAIQDPVSYRNDCLSRSEWVKPIVYSINSLIVAGIFVIPLFWESKVEVVRAIRHVSWNATHDVEESSIGYQIAVTPFRMDHRYILWYKNIATFLVTLFVPLTLLIYYNVNTYLGIRARSLRRVTTVNNEIIKREEEFKARILFVIIIIFFLCNSLRFVINFEECLAQRDYN